MNHLIVGQARYLALGAVISVAVLAAGCDSDRAAAPAPIRGTQVKAVDTPPPEYPLELACDNIGGQVILSVVIGKDGRPTQARVQRSSGIQALDDSAQEGVHDWQFRAATTNGQPVETTIQVPMTFNPPKVRPQRCFVLDEQRD